MARLPTEAYRAFADVMPSYLPQPGVELLRCGFDWDVKIDVRHIYGR